jgi:YidC/Oxa1 family membrane protein insertase
MGSDQKRAFLAVILSGVVLFTWQSFFAPKTPPAEVKQEAAQTANNNPKAVANSTGTNAAVEKTNAPMAAAAAGEQNTEKFTDYQLNNGEQSFVVDNFFRIKDAKNPKSVFTFSDTVGEQPPFEVQVLDGNYFKNVNFVFNQTRSDTIIASNAHYGISMSLSLDGEGRLFFNLNSSRPYKYRWIFKTTNKELENAQMRRFMYFSQDTDDVVVGSDANEELSLKWFSIDFNYHMMAMVFDKKEDVKLVVTPEGVANLDGAKPTQNISGKFIFTKKNYDNLKALGDNLDLAVDFGIFGIVAVPLLRGLQFFYKYIPNYGIAIILLTLLVRLALFPLQYKSFKSMKKMQDIQPELGKIKEKFKDDPQRMQKETMELFKRAGANPLGGCLPLLLQMPVFLAFYRVLGSSVELVGAPFIAWIGDLSIKDPLYILPVLMGLSMFLNQKITPTTSTDPTQQKIMLLMPLVFGFIMKDLPAGLVLYIFISTLFGMIFQLLVFKTSD